MLKKILFFFISIVVSLSAFAQEGVQIPNLKSRLNFLGEVQPTAAQKIELESNLKVLDNNGKVQLAILVVDSVKPLTIEDYSMKVVEKWKLGMKGVDNGVLFLVATKDRKARIEVGRGLEGVLTDVYTNRIQREQMAPLFKKGDFVGGINKVVSSISEKTKPEVTILAQQIEQQVKSEQSSNNSGEEILLIILALVFPIGFIFWVYYRQNKKEELASMARQQAAQEYYLKKRSEEFKSYPFSQSNMGIPKSSYRSSYENTKASSSPIKKSSHTTSSTKSSRNNSRKDDDSVFGISSVSSYSSSDSGSSWSSSSSSDDSWSKSSSSSSSSSSDSFSGGGGSFSGGGSSSDW